MATIAVLGVPKSQDVVVRVMDQKAHDEECIQLLRAARQGQVSQRQMLRFPRNCTQQELLEAIRAGCTPMSVCFYPRVVQGQGYAVC